MLESPHPITSSTDPAFDSLWEIYHEAIPPSETKTRDELAAMVSRSDYCVLLFQRQKVATAFTIMFVPSGENYALLEYMAVAKSVRNDGMGSRVFQVALSPPYLPETHATVILEVDSPRERTAKDCALRERRVSFYRRNGCVQISNLHYLFPLVCQAPAPEMDLLVHLRGVKRRISKKELHAWLSHIFVEVYHCKKEDDRIEKMIDGLNEYVVLV